MYKKIVTAHIFALATALVAGAPATAATSEAAHTSAAVIAVDHDWTTAEIHGDTKYLDQLLTSDYRSVDPHGKAKTKADILASARENGSSVARQQKIRQYLSTHPLGEAVAFYGDTAILTFYAPKLGPQRGVLSVDVFVFENGGWHAIYSQHTDATG